MCGIVGYIGSQEVTQMLLEGLRALEYRGYDSAGIALANATESATDSSLTVLKAVGKLHNLADLVQTHTSELSHSHVGIGHTRWATHGVANLVNAHPQQADAGKLAIVHNGIIENFKTLKTQLVAQGCQFQSETDTEVIAQLIAMQLQNTDSLVTAIQHAVAQLEGSFALAVLHQSAPEQIIAVRRRAPLVIGLGEQENFLASDIVALMRHTNQIIYLEDNELAILHRDHVEIRNAQNQVINKMPETIQLTAETIDKQGYAHFMLKEIHEQASIIRQTLAKYLAEPTAAITLGSLPMTQFSQQIKQIEIIACGTSLHAALVTKQALEELTKIRVTPISAGEYIYNPQLTDSNTLVIGISQSGETADTISAIKQAKTKQATIVILTNRLDSTIVQYADYTLPLNVGIEVSVAATKSYTAQLIVLYLFSIALAETLKTAPVDILQQLKQELLTIPTKIEEILSNSQPIEQCAQRFYQYPAWIYMSRGINIASALEGALKLKEISYINANAYSAGELKHGPIALLDSNMPVLAILIQDSPTYLKILANCEEAKARNSPLIAVTSSCDPELKRVFDQILPIPATNELLSPLLATIPLQLLAYYVAKLLQRDIDQPRNLAKSVTVE